MKKGYQTIIKTDSSRKRIQTAVTKMKALLNFNFYLQTVQALGFLSIFYGALLGISCFMYVLANHIVLRRDIPPLTGEQSFLQLQPSISVLPRPDSLTSIIRYQARNRGTYLSYIHDLFGYEQSYERHGESSRLQDCTKHVSYIDHPKFSCKFSLDLGTIGCQISSQYGYEEADPCVLIKLNRVYGWIPKFSEESLNTSVRHGFPTIKIKCDGVNDIDKVNIGRVCYYDEESALRRTEGLLPDQEGGCSEEYGQIRNYYFPYKKQRSYQNPFVWVKFFGVQRNVVIMIQCWAIADNIRLNEEDGTGYVRFEIMAD